MQSESDTAGTDLRRYLHDRGPMRPEQAALFVAELAEQLAALHARGLVLGPPAGRVHAATSDGRPHPVVVAPARQTSPASMPDDVREAGALLAELLGNDGPDSLRMLAGRCLETDPAARPTAAVLARQLRGAIPDLLLGIDGLSSNVDIGPAPAPEYVPRAEPAVDKPPAGGGGRRVLLAAATVVVILAAAGTAVALTRGRQGHGAPVAAQDSSAAPGSSATQKPSAAPGSSAAPSSSAARRPGGTPGSPPSGNTVCLPSDCAAQVTFQREEDRLHVCDNKKDGLSAVASASYQRPDEGDTRGMKLENTGTDVWASDGEGTCVDFDLGMASGTEITIRACVGEAAVQQIKRCSDPVTYAK